MDAGRKLKEIRVMRGLSMRDVEEASKEYAERVGNQEFTISSAWLTQVENKESTPSIYKLYFLSIIYHLSISELLLLFDLSLELLPALQDQYQLKHSHLAKAPFQEESFAVQFPVRLDPGFDSKRTNLVPRMVETWGEVPLAVLQRLNPKNSLYGYIGTDDVTMSPVLRPGSFVEIDPNQVNTSSAGWRTELDRPIYFVELHDKYVCSWCEIHGSELYVVPHPLSGIPIQHYQFPRDAEIVGRVTSAFMRIVPRETAQGKAGKGLHSRLPQ